MSHVRIWLRPGEWQKLLRMTAGTLLFILAVILQVYMASLRRTQQKWKSPVLCAALPFSYGACACLFWPKENAAQLKTNVRPLRSTSPSIQDSTFTNSPNSFWIFRIFSPPRGSLESEAVRRLWAVARRVITCPLILFSWAAISTQHAVVFGTIPKMHEQSREITLILSSIPLFTALVGLALARQQCLRVSLETIPASRNKAWTRDSPRPKSLRSALTAAALLLTVFSLYHLHFSSPSTSSLLLNPFGDEVSPCALEGRQLATHMRTALVWPDFTPRRLFNFYTGSETCGKNVMSFVDAEAGVVVLDSTCPQVHGRVALPRVILERPEGSELNSDAEPLFPALAEAAAEWQRLIACNYGPGSRDDVRIVRSRSNKWVSYVEVLPKALIPVHRVARSAWEARFRSGWSLPDMAVEVPFGNSSAITVLCDESGYEEYHMHPPQPAAPLSRSGDPSPPQRNHTDRPPTNILMLMIDSTSRPEVVRSLPKFSLWLSNLRRTLVSHVVVSADGATTLGHSTSRNFVPSLTGRDAILQNGSNTDIFDNNIFKLVKDRYGDAVSTSWTTGQCDDQMADLFGAPNATAGLGHAHGSIDYYTYGPYCNLQYSALHSNFQGPYSIVKRCMGQEYVHEHTFKYVRELLKRQMRDQQQQNRSFVNLAYFIEAHEGTHTVLALLDDGLVSFLETLQSDLHYFNDPRNVLVIYSDHGNHMGPYFGAFPAGNLERTMPFEIVVASREALSNHDLRRGRAVGSTEATLRQRTRQTSTAADLYLTFADLLEVHAATAPEFESEIKSTSLLSPRRVTAKGPVMTCADVSLESECSLSFCAP